MVYNLRKKFILVSTISVVIVVSCIFLIMVIVSNVQLNNTMDTLTDAIASNNGVFPAFDEYGRSMPSDNFLRNGIITEESPYSTRFFTVWINREGQIMQANVESIFSITEPQTQEFVEIALKDGTQRGWVSDYRYQVFDTSTGQAIVFVNGEMNRTMTKQSLLLFFLVLTGSGMAVLLLIILISKRVVRPVAESYEKQKQFITDANHELKTPLTLILSNLDIVESEVGKNEWLDDIRSEGERMGLLLNQLVVLSRMDEDHANLHMIPFDLTNAVSDTISEFQGLAEERQKTLVAVVEPQVSYQGDEGLIRRLMAILLDNAVKYCDVGGRIQVTLSNRRHPVITVENTYSNVDTLELDKLFDRFYRADKARTFDGGFGVGLSIAKAMAKNHHGEITVYKKDGIVGFRVELK